MSSTADIKQMKTDVPLKGYFCDTKAERGKKKKKICIVMTPSLL